ncbi:MAG: DUF2497 domain-containing protein [Alphaproteobacteria bacterium]|nr:DUF2497 domain-containing protein [Alphaproteobacteria bacterium]
MSDKSSKTDPSMNEILGSIRRIISEDNAQPAEAATPPEDRETPELADTPDIGFSEETPVGISEADDPGLAGYTLIEVPEDAGSEVPEEASDEYFQDAAPEYLEEEEDILDLTEEMIADSAAESIGAASDSLADNDFEEPALQQEPAMIETPAEAAPSVSFAETHREPEAEAHAAPASVFGQRSTEKIVSETATTAAATALGELTRAMDEKTNKLKVGAGDTSVADMVKEMLRPMLREWIDENLPAIVERIVRREIEKLVDRAETED